MSTLSPIHSARRTVLIVEDEAVNRELLGDILLCVMPIDALKIDMKFVRNVVNSSAGYRMVELVIEMARALNVPTVVEGVEDEAQYRMMKRVGCDVIQGYYFSRLVPAKEFEPPILQTR